MTHKGRAYAAWVVICVVWGTTYLAIRIAIEAMPPLLMAGLRWIVAGGILLVFFRMRGEPLPRLEQWSSLVVRGILLVGFGNGAVVWAEQTVPSGLTSVLVAIVPFWMIAAEILFGDGQRPTLRQWVGLTLGFAGVLLVIGPQLGLDLDRQSFVAGLIATQLACAGWALGSTYARNSRRKEGTPAAAAPACEMLAGGIVLLACGLTIGERLEQSVTTRSAAALLYLIVFGSIVAFSAYRYALQHLPVATVSLYVYVNTIIAVILGTVVLDEPFNWRMGVGAAVVLAGIALVQEHNG